MELTDLWGVARRTAEKLIALGITTPLQLRDADPRFLRERFSVVLERTVHELRGTPCIAFEDVIPNRKSIRVDQAIFGVQVRWSRRSTLARMVSLRMMAVMATLGGFPAAMRA